PQDSRLGRPKTMKIAIVGATGNVGQRLIAEATSRGHQVTAIARKVEGLADNPAVTPVAADLTQPDQMVQALADHDVVILSVRFQDLDFDKALAVLRKAQVKRLLIVGGAASLEV